MVSAQSALDASQVGLEVGTRTVLDVLQNQRTLFQAQVEYAQARYNFLQNRLVLEQAAGTLDGTDVQDINRLLTADAESRLSSQPVWQQLSRITRDHDGGLRPAVVVSGIPCRSDVSRDRKIESSKMGALGLENHGRD